MPNLFRGLGALLGASACICACGVPRLEPVHSSAELGPHTAAASSSGVRLVANAQSWSGSGTVDAKLIPVEIAIVNRSTENLEFSGSDVELVSGGERLHSLPPRSIRLRELRMTTGVAPGRSDWGDIPFRVSRSDTESDFDPSLTYEVASAALPDGPIRSGQSARGFVYFKPLPKGLSQVELSVLLRTSEGNPAVALRVPFRVER